MRRGPYRLVMAAAFAAAACQNECNPDCLTGAELSVSANLAAAVGDQPAACGGVQGLRLVLETVSGNGQLAPVGSLVQPAPVVRLLTAFLRTPAENIPVLFTITSGRGRFEPGNPNDQVLTVFTDADGHAAIPWVLGSSPGGNSITASVDGVPLNATVSGTPQTITVTATPAATIGAVAGSNQTGAAGSILTVDPEVLVLDANGTPVQNFLVAFAVSGGGGNLTHVVNSVVLPGGPATTDFFGRAKATWGLGTAAGSNTLTVTAAGPGLTGSPVTFTATGVAGAAHTLSLHAGNDQSALRNTEVAVRPAVRLLDVNQNPVPGVVVTFTETQGGGTVQGPTATTDANGVATVGGWTLGANAGPNRLTAQAAGSGIIGNPVEFTATATTPVPAFVVAFAGDGQTGPAGFPLPIRPAVRVTDAGGAPVAGEPVLFLLASGTGLVSGSISGASQTTDQNGVATLGGWTLANQAGSNRLSATVLSLNVAGDPVTFNATGVAGTPVIMAKVAGDNQSAPVGFSPEVLPTVRIADFFNNPVPGVTVTFAVTGGGGTISGAVVVTNAQGRATVGGWQMGPTPGTNTLSATASATTITGNPATFSANGFIAGVRAPRP